MRLTPTRGRTAILNLKFFRSLNLAISFCCSMLPKFVDSKRDKLAPHFSQTLRSQWLKALRSKALTPFKREDKKQHTVETLILYGFGYIRVVACQNYFVRNAGCPHEDERGSYFLTLSYFILEISLKLIAADDNLLKSLTSSNQIKSLL